MSRSIDEVARDLSDADRILKHAEKAKESLRKEFFSLATEQVRVTHVLKKRALTIPKSFFDTTGMTFEQFVVSRYPTWRLAEHKQEDEMVVLIIEEDPDFSPFTYQHPETREIITRQVAEASPQIDLETLRLENPLVWLEITRPVTSYELNEEALTALCVERPEIVALIQRHYRYGRKPSQKLAPIRVAKDEE